MTEKILIFTTREIGVSIKLISEFPGIVSRLILGVSLWLAAPAVFAEYGLNFPKPVTPVAHRILELHNMILLICVIIFVIVFGIMFYSIFAHRKSRGHKAAQFHDNSTMEVIWTVIPFLILVRSEERRVGKECRSRW